MTDGVPTDDQSAMAAAGVPAAAVGVQGVEVVESDEPGTRLL